MAASSLYGLSVSWPYLRIARGEGKEGTGTVVNLLDTIDLHRRIAAFCRHIAANPHILLNPNSDLSIITLDGKPYQDALLIEKLQRIAPELGKDLNKTITAMFSGAAHGWDIFTEEFAVGGLIDSLTPKQRQLLFIPATNDANEGALGSWRVHLCYNPNSTTATFSAKARLERNDTENFILTQMTDENHRHVMRVVRRKNSDRSTLLFRHKLMEMKRKRAITQRKKREETAQKRADQRLRLLQIPVITDKDRLLGLNVKELKAQLDIYRKILKDLVVTQKEFRVGDVKTKAKLQEVVLAAAAQHIQR